MYEFIVLGLVPGTQIQISFGAWLLIAGMLAAAVTFRKAHRSNLIRNLVVGWAVFFIVRRQLRA